MRNQLMARKERTIPALVNSHMNAFFEELVEK